MTFTLNFFEECGCGTGKGGKLNYWLYGFKSASAWEKLYVEKFESVGFVRGRACGVICYHAERDLLMAVHVDGFTLCNLEEDLWWMADLMGKWLDINVRAVMGSDPWDDKEVTN